MPHLLLDRGGRVQEFCNGGSLRQALEKRHFTAARMPARWAPTMAILRGTAAGMAYMHSKRICHGDLNPSNILLKVRHNRARLILQTPTPPVLLTCQFCDLLLHALLCGDTAIGLWHRRAAWHPRHQHSTC